MNNALPRWRENGREASSTTWGQIGIPRRNPGDNATRRTHFCLFTEVDSVSGGLKDIKTFCFFPTGRVTILWERVATPLLWKGHEAKSAVACRSKIHHEALLDMLVKLSCKFSRIFYSNISALPSEKPSFP